MGDGIAVEAPFAPPLPDDVAFVALDETDPDLPPLYPAEEELLGPRTAPQRRQEFTLGRVAARRALRQLGYGSPPILRGNNHEPLWPSGIVGSITHANGHALAAVGRVERCGGIGLDLEHHARWFPELSDQIAFGAEETWLGALPAEARAMAALELFSAQESVYKAFFPRVRRYFGFEAVRLWRRRDARSFTGWFVEPLDPAYPPTRSFRVHVRWHGDLVLTSLVLPFQDGGLEVGIAPGEAAVASDATTAWADRAQPVRRVCIEWGSPMRARRCSGLVPPQGDSSRWCLTVDWYTPIRARRATSS